MVKAASGHYGIKLETAEKKKNEVMYLDKKEDDLTSFKVIKRLHR